jgi:hypothetical protein
MIGREMRIASGYEPMLEGRGAVRITTTGRFGVSCPLESKSFSLKFRDFFPYSILFQQNT